MPDDPRVDVLTPEPQDDKEIIAPGYTFGTVTDQIATVVLTRKTPKFWFGGLAVGTTLLMFFLLAVVTLFVKGIGIWGLRAPVMWAFDITNFVWWIGIGHAGTLISAILLLLNQRWRNSINRFAEAMTLFAVACAGMFPILHLGRPWLMYWLFPYPNTMGIEPNFRSPLVWDVFAVSTYGTVSLLFWYVGLIPDLSTLRDRAHARFARFAYGILAMGWRGSARHWAVYETASLLLAGIATPLVLSVHTVVSFDFTVGIVPGWHSTFFPPYFVAGAIYSGFAMVLALAIPLRSVYGLQGLITDKHLDNSAKVMLATGLLVGYAYILEAFTAWYSGNVYEEAIMLNRMTGPYATQYWTLIACNVLAPNFLWFKKVRSSPLLLFSSSLVVLVGMWLERYVIIASSLAQDHLVSSWGVFHPTRWDWLTYFGTIGLFLFLFFIFIRLLPMISIFEMRTLLPQAKVDEEAQKVTKPLYGVMAEFDSPTALVNAARAAHEEGYRKLDAYSPFPIEELNDVLHLHKNKLPLLVLVGGILGALAGYFLQYYVTVIYYPTNIAGRPLHSWPAYIIITFEVTILFAASTTVLGLLALCGLPMPYHPVFNVPRFALASRSRFFLCIEATDPLFDHDRTSEFLETLEPREVSEVAH